MGTLYVGIDVDDKAFHVASVDCKGAEGPSFVVRGSINKLAKEIKAKIGTEVSCCYEASYCGFSIARTLIKRNLNCEVIAPTSIVRSANDRIKNDRSDALKLAKQYSKGLLQVVCIPDESRVSDRSLTRNREFLQRQTSSLKRHILAQFREFGFDYRKEIKSEKASYWTKAHYKWIESTLSKAKDELSNFKESMSVLIASLSNLESSLMSLDQQIASTAERQSYKDLIVNLKAFKGIETLTALNLAVEIGDIRRFVHPKQLVAYLGLDVREKSSGGKQRQFGISKMGNKRIRRLLVEGAQLSIVSASPSKILLKRRKGLNREIIEIAERCRLRMYQKGKKLKYRNKPINVIKTATAREMVTFIWEVMMKTTPIPN